MNRIFSLQNIFIFLFLLLFPFGQIVRIGIIQPVDVVVGLGAVYAVVKKLPKPRAFKYLNNFLFVAVVSWIFSIFIFHSIEVLYGLLYFIRLAAYFYFLIYVWNFVKLARTNGKLLVDSLLVISTVSAFFGWIQFIWMPSIKPFFVFGWDEHLFRLVGTFLDPTYLGLIIVFGLIISMIRFIEEKNKYYLLLVMFLLTSLAFTYSRASYLAFLVGVAFIGIYKKKIRIAAFTLLGLLLLILMLPTSANHVLMFTRSFSAIARIGNYETTFGIFTKSPVLGVGYDNLCLAYQKYIGYQSYASHACSGSDSSLLFVLTATGVVGFIVFVQSILMISRSLLLGPDQKVLVSTFAAVLIHSLFSNSMFYPWIMGWIIILLAVSLGNRVSTK